jgi:hypothetical protein
MVRGLSGCPAWADTMASQVRLEQSTASRVGLDHAVGLVLGPEMPLEGAGQVG